MNFLTAWRRGGGGGAEDSGELELLTGPGTLGSSRTGGPSGSGRPRSRCLELVLDTEALPIVQEDQWRRGGRS